MLTTNMRTASELTRAVNLLPVKPTYFGDLGLFEEKGSPNHHRHSGRAARAFRPRPEPGSP